MVHLEAFRDDLAGDFGAYVSATCRLAATKTFGWNTCAASSSLVMSLGCFFIFFGMVTL